MMYMLPRGSQMCLEGMGMAGILLLSTAYVKITSLGAPRETPATVSPHVYLLVRGW
jgi:hypothetical protein